MFENPFYNIVAILKQRYKVISVLKNQKSFHSRSCSTPRRRPRPYRSPCGRSKLAALRSPTATTRARLTAWAPRCSPTPSPRVTACRRTTTSVTSTARATSPRPTARAHQDWTASPTASSSLKSISTCADRSRTTGDSGWVFVYTYSGDRYDGETLYVHAWRLRMWRGESCSSFQSSRWN